MTSQDGVATLRTVLWFTHPLCMRTMTHTNTQPVIHCSQVLVVNPHSEHLCNNTKDYRQVLMMVVVKTRTYCSE